MVEDFAVLKGMSMAVGGDIPLLAATLEYNYYTGNSQGCYEMAAGYYQDYLDAKMRGNEEQEKVYAQYRDKFIAEARRLAKIGR